MTPEEKEAALESRLSGLAKAANDNAAALDALLKKPSADPAKVESLGAEIGKLLTEIATLKGQSVKVEPGFMDSVGAFLDSIFE